MTITATTMSTLTALGNGVNTDHTIGFIFQDNDHIAVYVQDEGVSPYTLTQLTYGADFTITGGDPGITVVMSTPITAAQRAYIVRETPRKQTVDYVATQAFPAVDHEEQMDRQSMMEQEISDKMSRTLQLWPTVSGFDPILPSNLAANDSIVVNATGDGFVAGPTVGAIGAGIAAAAASAAAALASETAAAVSAAASAASAVAADASAIAAAAIVGGAVTPLFEVTAPIAGARNGVNQVFTLAHTPYPGGKVGATVDGALVESLTPVGNTVTISAPLAADLANLGMDLKFTYIRTIAAPSQLNVNRVATSIDYTALVTDSIIGVTNTAIPRTITLPDNATAGSGFILYVADESGGAGANTITVDAAGADTVDGAGSATITTNYGKVTIYATGSGLWKTI